MLKLGARWERETHEVMGVPESFEGLVSHFLGGGRVHQEHDQEDER